MSGSQAPEIEAVSKLILKDGESLMVLKLGEDVGDSSGRPGWAVLVSNSNFLWAPLK